MKYIVSSAIHPLYDAVRLLSWKASGDDPEALDPYFDAEKRDTITPEQREARKLLQNAYHDIFAQLNLDADDLSLFLPDVSSASAEESLDVECSLTLPFLCGYPLGVDEVAARVARQSEDTLRAIFVSYLSGEDSDTLPPNLGDAMQYASLDAFARLFLTQGDWSPAQRCHILAVHTDYHKLFARATQIIKRCMAAIEAVLPSLAPVMAQYEAITANLDKDGCPLVFSDKFNLLPLLFKQQDNPIPIHPQLALPKSVAVHVRNSRAHAMLMYQLLFPEIRGTTIHVGMLTPYAGDLLAQRIHTPETLPATLKHLSDRSKFDILLLLAHRPYYGAQLAQELSLSPATISHHMNALLNAGLVLVDEQNSRTYYRLNVDGIELIAHALHDFFIAPAK